MLKRCTIENFLNFRKTDAEFGGINVLVGDTASGKTNLMKSLLMINTISNGSHYDDMSKFLDDNATNTSFSVDLEINDFQSTYSILFENGQLSESLTSKDQNLLSHTDGKGFVIDVSEINGQRINGDKNKLFLKECHQYGDKPNIKNVSDFISKWTEYTTPETVTTAMSKSLFYLHQVYKDSFNVMSDFVCEMGYNGIELDLNNEKGETALIKLDNNSIPIVHLSKNQLNLMALKFETLGCFDFNKGLVMFYNPENGLDINHQRLMAQILCDFSKYAQIIVETHSPDIIDVLHTNENMNLMYFENDNDVLGTKISNLEQLSDRHAGFDGWVDDFGLGSALLHSRLLQK